MLSLIKAISPYKLVYHSKHCIFLGYSNNQKGYHCLDLETNKVCISKNVLFDEISFPVRKKYQDSLYSGIALPSGNFPILAYTILSHNLMTNFINVETNTTFVSPPTSNINNHSFETRPGDRPDWVIGSQVKWVDPGQLKKRLLFLPIFFIYPPNNRVLLLF